MVIEQFCDYKFNPQHLKAHYPLNLVISQILLLSLSPPLTNSNNNTEMLL